jgi:ribonuclease HI
VPSFECQTCGKAFQVEKASLDKYPGWSPKRCLTCRGRGAPDATQAKTRKSGGRAPRPPQEECLTTAEVLQKYQAGPDDGVFTDGAAHPNPGRGGWGAVLVRRGTLVTQAHGQEAHTTNNRMELTALIQGCALVPPGERATLWTDSQLCVNTITKWASGWERNGWTRKAGPIKNLELVKELYELCQRRPELELRWIAAHSGNRWNEYADALATAYRRDVL